MFQDARTESQHIGSYVILVSCNMESYVACGNETCCCCRHHTSDIDADCTGSKTHVNLTCAFKFCCNTVWTNKHWMFLWLWLFWLPHAHRNRTLFDECESALRQFVAELSSLSWPPWPTEPSLKNWTKVRNGVFRFCRMTPVTARGWNRAPVFARNCAQEDTEGSEGQRCFNPMNRCWTLLL